jgi:phosphatidylglycerol:prolipoprotein diacylglycerol transferase
MSFPYLSDFVYWLTGWRLPLPLAMFGLFVAFGALAAAACLRRELARLYEKGAIGAVTHKIKRPDGTAVMTEVAPQALVSDFAMVVLVAGVIGSRVFHILEHLDEFGRDPWSMIFSRSGLSIYGGLIFGAGAGLLLLRRWRIPVRPFMDAIAPALMLGYGIGRLGCQISGDGDWGIAADMAAKPLWLPTWLWAQTYQHNIAGVVIAAPGVYPAPIYESLMAAACFALLWALRKHPFQSGWLFSLYLVLAGAERFLIEQIRVNVRFHFHGMTFTQAELISVVYLCLGLVGLAVLSRPARALRQAGG